MKVVRFLNIGLRLIWYRLYLWIERQEEVNPDFLSGDMDKIAELCYKEFDLTGSYPLEMVRLTLEMIKEHKNDRYV